MSYRGGYASSGAKVIVLLVCAVLMVGFLSGVLGSSFGIFAGILSFWALGAIALAGLVGYAVILLLRRVGQDQEAHRG
ncbi:hypothetical protein [Sphingomonas sp.]|uniref:hypothetical protein n=1 Tax=Sphingomonas sp. TaxID=28214 RepID=UPI0035BC44E7